MITAAKVAEKVQELAALPAEEALAEAERLLVAANSDFTKVLDPSGWPLARQLAASAVQTYSVNTLQVAVA